MAYQFQSSWVRNWLLQHAIGTTLASLNEPTLRAVPVVTPPIEEQRSIAATLGAIDDKIESNRRATIHVRTLIRLHFEHVLARGAVKSIPLGQLVTITKGRSYKSAELAESTTALVTLKSIDRSGGYKQDGLKPYVGDFKPEQIVRAGELVVAQTDLTQGAEVVGRGVRVPGVSQFDTLVASLDLAIVRPKGDMPVEYLYGLLTSEPFRQHCRSHVTGTTVLHLAKDAMPTWSAPVIGSAEQEAFATVARALLARMDALADEVGTLQRLRDGLLPELLSGSIRTSVSAPADRADIGKNLENA